MSREFKTFARYLEDNYGALFDRKEGFVCCPECGEPIYDCDWTVDDYTNEEDDFICPVCGEPLE